jgi:hypothetical protein
LRRKKIIIIIRGGALIGSIIVRNAGFSGCAAWKKLKPCAEKEGAPCIHQHLESLRKARPDLADKVHHVQKRESRPPRKEWLPKPTRADVRTSADTHMVFVLRAEFHARPHEESVAQLDLGPWPVIFEIPQAKNYKHLKALYLKGYINSQPINKMLVDTGAAVNTMPYSVLRRLGRSIGDLIKTNVTLSDFNG